VYLLCDNLFVWQGYGPANAAALVRRAERAKVSSEKNDGSQNSEAAEMAGGSSPAAFISKTDLMLFDALRAMQF
jgi:hypothetical protein